MTYLLLALAIVFEVGWATAMKASHGFTRPLPAAITILAYVLSLVFLTLAVRKLDISVAYAIWAGLGAAIIAGIGILYFQEPINLLKAGSLALIVVGIIGVRLSGTMP
jgi:small multidrug resistance pump